MTFQIVYKNTKIIPLLPTSWSDVATLVVDATYWNDTFVNLRNKNHELKWRKYFTGVDFGRFVYWPVTSSVRIASYPTISSQCLWPWTRTWFPFHPAFEELLQVRVYLPGRWQHFSMYVPGTKNSWELEHEPNDQSYPLVFTTKLISVQTRPGTGNQK